MKDKRKFIFCLISLVLVIIGEYFLYKSAQKKDFEYKQMIEKKLSKVISELEERQFESKSDYKLGKLEYEREKDGYEYGYICMDYDLNGQISDLDIKLVYSDSLYIDDIFYDAYYIFNLLDLNIENEYNLETDLAENFVLNDEIFVNDNKYKMEIKKTEDEKIIFEIN